MWWEPRKLLCRLPKLKGWRAGRVPRRIHSLLKTGIPWYWSQARAGRSGLGPSGISGISCSLNQATFDFLCL